MRVRIKESLSRTITPLLFIRSTCSIIFSLSQIMAYEISDDVSMPLSTIIEVTEVSRRSPSPKTILLTDVSQRLYKRKRFYKQLYEYLVFCFL